VISTGGSNCPVIIYLVECIKSISTVTNRDYAQICSSFMTLTKPKYRCGDCKHKYSRDKERWGKHREHMACNYMAEKPRHSYTPDNCNSGNPRLLYKKCVGNYYNGFWSNMINYYPQYEKGLLPFKGSLMEQPAKFVDVMSLVHNLIREKNIEQEKQAKTNVKRRSKR